MRVAPVLVLLVLSAGCLAPITDRLRGSDVEPPRWSLGDWWTYQLSSEVYDSQAEVTVVVANKTGGGFALGTPVDQDVTHALLQHLPPIGPVGEDLSWEVHEERFEPLQFPLEDGKSWTTKWIAAEVRLTARLLNGTWNVSNEGYEEDANMRYDILYDPAVEAITSFKRTDLQGRVRQLIEMTGNGTGYQGDVRALGNIDVALLESRTRGTLAGGVPTAPNPTFSAPEAADTLLVACVLGGAPGQYHAEVRSPTGVICQLDQTIQPGDAAIRSQVVEVDAEAGDWEARLLAVGDGNAAAEVLAYPTYVVTLGNASASS